MFEGLFALEDLHLDNNDISLEPGAFVNLPCLNWLNLESNKLKTLEMKAFLDPTCPDKHPSKIFVPLGWNPLKCDEKLCWLKEAEQNNWIEVDHGIHSPVTCGSYYPSETYWRDVNLNCNY